MVGGLVIGFVVGVLLGIVLTLAAVRSRRPATEETARAAPTPAMAAESDLGEPIPGPDDEVQRALDATAGLLDDLETRYRDRKAPADDEEGRAPRRRRRT